jgi:hypothetical protein
LDEPNVCRNFEEVFRVASQEKKRENLEEDFAQNEAVEKPGSLSQHIAM